MTAAPECCRVCPELSIEPRRARFLACGSVGAAPGCCRLTWQAGRAVPSLRSTGGEALSTSFWWTRWRGLEVGGCAASASWAKESDKNACARASLPAAMAHEWVLHPPPSGCTPSSSRRLQATAWTNAADTQSRCLEDGGQAMQPQEICSHTMDSACGGSTTATSCLSPAGTVLLEPRGQDATHCQACPSRCSLGTRWHACTAWHPQECICSQLCVC